MTDLHRRFTPLRLAGLSGFLLAILTGGLTLSGCGSDSSDGDSGSPGSKPADKQNSIAISSIIESLQPDEYDISVPRDLPTTYLNAWGKENLETLLSDDVDEDALKKQLSAHLTDEQVERVLRREFVIRDSAHFRDMIWARKLIAEKSIDDEPELAMLTRLFYHVVHTVRLIDDVETPIPLSPFETMLYGRGTAADRAWIFSCLTRQLKLPLLLVELGHGEAAGDGPESSLNAPLIGGLLHDGKVYLFDFQVGLPIPSASSPPEEPLPSVPATLEEVQNDDALLRALDVKDGLAYRATSSQFQQVKLLLAGESSVWARRVEAVTYEMPKSNAMPVFWEPLVSHGAFEEEGIIDIVTEGVAGRVKPDALGIWKYPETQRAAREELTTEQGSLLDQLHEPMQAPRPYRQSFSKGEPKLEYGSGRQIQLKARVAQTLGRPQDAIPLYVKMQTWRNTSPKADSHQITDESLREKAKQLPEEILKLHSRAALEASFWQATSQLELGRHSAAADTFEFWIRTSPSPELTGQSILLIAISRALQGDLIIGGGFLKRLPKENASYQKAQILRQRWQAIDAAKAN